MTADHAYRAADLASDEAIDTGPLPPAFVTEAEAGAGFVEFAEALSP